ncbi:MAG: hypothetical protein AB7F74_08755, partial [Parvibaculaceae bacterium]
RHVAQMVRRPPFSSRTIPKLISILLLSARLLLRGCRRAFALTISAYLEICSSLVPDGESGTF